VGVAFNDTIWQKLNEVICDVSAVPDGSDMTELKIYPNPASQYFTVDLEDGYYDILISNVTVHNVYEQKHGIGAVRIHCEEFPAGVYFVTVGTERNKIVRKLIIQ